MAITVLLRPTRPDHVMSMCLWTPLLSTWTHHHCVEFVQKQRPEWTYKKMATIYTIDALEIVTTIHLDSNLDNNPRYSQDIPKRCPRYAKDTPNWYRWYAQDMQNICLKYDQGMSEICPNYVQDTPELWPRYANNMSKVCLITIALSRAFSRKKSPHVFL